MVCIHADASSSSQSRGLMELLAPRFHLSSRAVAAVLRRALRNVQVAEFEGLGHMGPLTHPQVVNETIASFLQSL